MKTKNNAIGLMALFVALAIFSMSASALPTCSDISFITAVPNVNLGTAFVATANPSSGTPDDPWGDYSTAELSVSSGLSSLPAVVNLSALTEATFNWNVNSTTTGSKTITANFTNSTASCEKSLSVTVEDPTAPNVAVTVSDKSELIVNVENNFTVTLNNTGNGNASNITVSFDMFDGKPIASQTVSLLQANQTTQLTFNVTSLVSNRVADVTALVTYYDKNSNKLLASGSDTFNVTGSVLPNPTGSFLIGGSAGQVVNFTSAVEATIDANAATSATLKVTTNQNVANPQITIARYPSVTNGSLSGFLSLGKYISVDVPSDFNPKISFATVRVSYTDAELSAAGILESSLKVYVYNTSTNLWDALTTTVNDASNFVEASVTHFSLFGLFGTAPPAAPVSGSGTGGGGGGGGSSVAVCKESDFTCTDWSVCLSGTQTRTCTKNAGALCVGTATKPAESTSCTLPTNTATGGSIGGETQPPANQSAAANNQTVQQPKDLLTGFAIALGDPFVAGATGIVILVLVVAYVAYRRETVSSSSDAESLKQAVEGKKPKKKKKDKDEDE